MASWLQKILPPPATKKGKNALATQRSGALPTQALPQEAKKPQALPNATVVYGIGASLFFVASFSLIIERSWFSGLIVFAIGACLMGFALHLLKHQD